MSLFCLLAVISLSIVAQPSQPSIQWIPAAVGAPAAVELQGLSRATLDQLARSNRTTAQWQRTFAVYAIPTGAAGNQVPPMLGAYRIRENSLRFEPQFPLAPGVTYRAVYTGGVKTKAQPIITEYRLPERETTPTTVVTRISPTADVLPENLLKFYLHFSAPMSRGEIYEHIHLREASGKSIELPFLEIGEELWNPAMTRVTLLIDPGRIKRGVLPLEEIGPALEEGKRYTLTIDKAWRDGQGNSLKEDYQKSFMVGPPDRDPPDPARWTIEAPKANTLDPLVVIFSDPMDEALAERVMTIIDQTGAGVRGTVALREQERRWIFTPERPWGSGRYELAIQTLIEDLAGNNIGKPFEVDLFNNIQRRLETPVVRKPFEIR